jgi:asparagine synthase (glutamine-hydrolysing)
MSGIAGVFRRDGTPIDAGTLARAHAAGRDRGVDGGRLWRDGCAGLSHQLLRCTPESSSDQPFADEASGLAITFDGRLDNREDLIASLDAPALAAAGDAWLVLRAYERWQQRAASRLLGDFSFAIWDRPARRLYCARDVIGIRPFCYSRVGDEFLFASELCQLLAAGVPADVDEGAVAEFLSNQITSCDATLYRHIRRLPAAHWMIVDERDVTVERYWSLETVCKLRYDDDREYAEQFSTLLREAVRARLRTDRTPVAAYVSGGIDSSSVVAVTQTLAADERVPVHAFSMLFPTDPAADERPYIESVVDFWKLQWHCGIVPPPSGDEYRDDAMGYRDIPDLPAEHMVGDLRATIRDRGIRVVLTGAGGDNGFAGSLHHYSDLVRQFRFAELWRQILDDARQPDIGWKPSRIFTDGVLPLLPRWFKDAVRPTARRFGWPGGPPSWIPAAFAARVDLEARVHATRCPIADACDASVCDAFQGGWTALMLEMSERRAARVGLDERHPFFDRRIAEFAFAIPERQRWDGVQTKRVVRHAMRKLLPPPVYDRATKADCSRYVVAALDAIGGAAALDRLEIAEAGWVDQRRVSEMYREMARRLDEPGDAFTEHMFPLWMVASIELWHRARTRT